ncbi:MAG: hypothetical protein ACRDL6_03120 [Solirubrobacterales bacterium]
MERGTWTDQRLDDFRDRVELCFDNVERQMGNGFDRVDRELIAIRGEIAEIRSLLFHFGGRIMVTLAGVIVALLGVIAAVISTG